MTIEELKGLVKELIKEKIEIKENIDIKISKLKKERYVKLKKIDKKISKLSIKIILQEHRGNDKIENIKIKEIDQYEVRCFIAQMSQNKIHDVDIINHFNNLKVQEVIDLLNKTVKKKNFLTIENRKKIIQRTKKGLLNHMLEYDLTDFINKLKNIMKGID